MIADNYLSFWFRFVLPNRSVLERGQTRYLWQAKVLAGLSTYMGARFEEACRQFIQLEPARWMHTVPELSRWWRSNGELEIAGHDDGRVVLAAQARWTEGLVGLDVLRTLQRRVTLLPNVTLDYQLVLFAKKGFTSELEALRSPALSLYTVADLLP